MMTTSNRDAARRSARFATSHAVFYHREIMPERTIPTLATWSAILMALLVGSVIQLTLNLFGAAFGLAAIAPALEQPGSARGVATQAMAWWFASSLLSLVSAGFIIGWLRQATGLIDTAIYASTVWALTTLVALWFATTLVGATASGAYGLIAGRPAPPPEVVIRFEGRGQGLVAGDAVAFRSQRVERGQELSDAVRSLTWLAVLEAAKQLRDPEVRAAIRQLTVRVWDDLEGFRGALADRLDAWIGPDGRLRPGALDDVIAWLSRELLIDAATAREIVEGWQARLSRIIAEQEKGAEGEVREGAGADGAADVAVIKDKVVAAIMALRDVLTDVAASGGQLGPERRAAAIDAVEEALAVTKERAERLVADWEERIGRAFSELTRLAAEAGRGARRLTRQGVEEASWVAAWIGVALLFGWLAVVAGAVGGSSLAHRQGVPWATSPN